MFCNHSHVGNFFLTLISLQEEPGNIPLEFVVQCVILITLVYKASNFLEKAIILQQLHERRL